MTERNTSTESNFPGIDLRKKLERILVKGEKRTRTFWEKIQKIPEITFITKDLGETVSSNWKGDLIIATEGASQPSKSRYIVVTVTETDPASEQVNLIYSYKISRKGKFYRWVFDKEKYEPAAEEPIQFFLKDLKKKMDQIFPEA